MKFPVFYFILVASQSVGCALKAPQGGHRGGASVSAALMPETTAQGRARLESAKMQMDALSFSFREFDRKSGSAWRKRGYFNTVESARMEGLLFRFVTARDALSDLAGSLGGNAPAGNADQAMAHLVSVNAQYVLVSHAAELVALFADDKVAVAKLNEAFYESQIAAGTFDRLRLAMTVPDLRKRLQASWILLDKEQQESSEEKAERLKGTRSQDPVFMKTAGEDHARAVAAVNAVQRGGRLGELEGEMTHSEAAKIARQLGTGWGDLKYKSRSLLFKTVSRMKNPEAKVIQFSKAQHAQVEALLQPGDIILTYTAGYMSDVFIPGAFKHGITYVGTPEQRRGAGVDASMLPQIAAPERATVRKLIDQAALPDGQKADVIEAVAEGVIFNNLAHIMDTHVNRLTVLRPRLSRGERAAFITSVFAYHGDAYDFLFDFGDASRQVCTEVIYRALNDRQGIHFHLTKRGGHPTLSADDVVSYHFKTGGQHFEFILYAEEDFAKGGHQAKVLAGAEGEGRLREVLTVKR